MLIKQLPRLHLQCLRQRINRTDRRISGPIFNSNHLASVNIGLKCQVILGKSLGFTQSLNLFPKCGNSLLISDFSHISKISLIIFISSWIYPTISLILSQIINNHGIYSNSMSEVMNMQLTNNFDNG